MLSPPWLKIARLPFLTCVAIYIYFNQFAFPWTPILRPFDYLIWLGEAQRINRGEVLYKDIFEFLTPGVPFVYHLLFSLFGSTAVTVNVSVALMGFVSAYLVLYMSERVLPPMLVYVPPILFLGIGVHFGLSASHRSFSSTFAMAAAAVLIQARTPRTLRWAGLLCACSSFFTQTRGAFVLAGLVAFVLWESRQKAWRQLGNLLGVYVVSLASLLLYFVLKAGIRPAFECLVVFPLKYYPQQGAYNSVQGYMADLPELHPLATQLPVLLVWCFLHAVLPLCYLLCLYRCYRGDAGEGRERAALILLSIVGLALFAEISRAPDIGRMFTISFPSFLVLPWLLRRPTWFNAAAIAAMVCLALVFVVPGSLVRQFKIAGRMRLPIGNVAFSDPVLYRECVWLSQRTTPGDYFFGHAYLFFPLDLRNPAKVPFLTDTAYTRPEQVDDVLRQVERHKVKYLFATPDDDDTLELGNSLAPYSAYVRTHYRRAYTVEDGEFWERR
jgi:hypothetical protein